MLIAAGIGACGDGGPEPVPAPEFAEETDGPMFCVVDTHGREAVFSVHAVSLHAEVFDVLLAAWEDGTVVWDARVPRNRWVQPRDSTTPLTGRVQPSLVLSVIERLRQVYDDAGLGEGGGLYSLGTTYVCTIRGGPSTLWLTEPEGGPPDRSTPEQKAWDSLWEIAARVLPTDGEHADGAARLVRRRLGH